MTTRQSPGESVRARVERRWPRVRDACFGDAAGLTLFLAFGAYLILIWRTGTFFNDVGLFRPALEHLANGQLALGAPSELESGYPGMYYEDGLVYARNYGQLALSLPAYWIARALGGVAIRALSVVVWSGLLFALAVRIGSRLGRRRAGAAVGGALAVAALVVNVFTFRPFLATQLDIIALQTTTMLCAAVVGLLLYRLFARRYDVRTGVFAGSVTVFASPVGFWATVPKRHTFTALFVVLALYALARSRDGVDGWLGQVGFRALAYASAGLLAWIHAPEGFTLFLAVAIVDLPTAPRNDRRSLAVIGGALALSLLPFLVTNYLVSGNPLEPPRFLTPFNGVDSLPASEGGVGDSPADGGSSGGGSAGGDGGSATSDGGSAANDGGSATSDGSGGDGSGEGIASGGSSSGDSGIDLTRWLPAEFATLLQIGLFRYIEGLGLLVTDLDRVSTVFLRWENQGYDTGNVFFGGGTNLSVLGSLPVAAAVVVAPVGRVVTAVRARAVDALFDADVDAVDAFAAVFSVLLVALYIVDLPVKVMVTVRYLHPLYPLLVYAVFRQTVVRRALSRHTPLALAGFAGTVVGGSLLATSALLAVGASKGAFVQTYGLVALVAAGALAVSLLASVGTERADRASAFCFGVATGCGTFFVLVTTFVLMHYGPSALPAFETASAQLRWLMLTS